jgi:hypothetical protein
MLATQTRAAKPVLVDAPGVFATQVKRGASAQTAQHQVELSQRIQRIQRPTSALVH